MSTTPVKLFAQRLIAYAEATINHGTNWIKNWQFASEHRQYLEELELSGELDALMEITGTTRDQLKSSEVSPLAAIELMERMMRTLEIRPDSTKGAAPALTDAAWRCQSCKGWRECRQWLDSGVKDNTYRDFCANAELLDSMRAKVNALR